MDLNQDLDRYIWQIEVLAVGNLDSWINDYFANLFIKKYLGNQTLLKGQLQDMNEFYGLIIKMRDTSLDIISLSVKRFPEKK